MQMIYLIFWLLAMFSSQSKTFTEKNGFVEIEAEQFHAQTNANERTWKIIDSSSGLFEGDRDSRKYKTASMHSFVELLPDTRITHDDKLIPGTNFSNEPGLSVLSYKVKFKTAGKYYVWVRAYSTGSEDNGLHVGLNDTWPESGRRMQWCDGKNQWTWDSKQRTEQNHCGEPEKIYLEIPAPGVHTIQFSMREDGFAFDKFALSLKYEIPKP